MKSIFLLIFMISANFTIRAQDDLPPIAAEPTSKNKILIDQLMEVSKFETVFKEYCVLAIDLEGRKRSWNAEEIKSRNARINFLQFMDQSVYNAFSDLTTSELKSMIKLAKKLNGRKDYLPLYFLSNSGLQNNLMFYVDSHCLR